MRIVNIECGIAAAFAVLIAIASPPAGAQQATAPAVAIDADDIGGVVRGPAGPEAGVWVIAETRDLPVRYIKIVVTDDQGRYVIPDLPKANYDVWVRGYGLVNSPKVKSEPGKQLNLTAVPAPSAAAAAVYYPAIYWYAMMKVPTAEQFGPKGDMPPNLKMTDYLNVMKNNGCVGCHQLGQLSTRTIPSFHLEPSKSHEEAWTRRIQAGQAGENMVTAAAGQLGGSPFKYLGDWTERVACLAARGQSKLKVRQPLRAAVVVAAGEERAAIERLAGVALEELNVKELRYVSQADELGSYEVKPNYRALGPRFGKHMPQVAAAVAALDPDHVARALREGSPVGVSIDGHDHELDADDLMLAMKPLEGYQLEREGSHAVALELELDDELRREGLAREVVHAVQNARKGAGLQVEDRIELQLGGDEELLAAARAFEDYIATETLAVAVAYDGLGDAERRPPPSRGGRCGSACGGSSAPARR